MENVNVSNGSLQLKCYIFKQFFHEACSAELAIIISYPTSVSGIIVSSHEND